MSLYRRRLFAGSGIPSGKIIPPQVKSSWRLKSGACSRGCLLPKAGGWPRGGRSEHVISDDDLAIVLRQVVECLRRSRVRYAIIGAWALSLWGKPRATADLDFLVLVNDQDLKRLSASMTEAGMNVDEVWQQWNPLLRGSQLRFECRGVTIDLLRPRDRHDQEMRRIDKRFLPAVEMTSLPDLASLRLCGRLIRIRESSITAKFAQARHYERPCWS